MDFIEEENRSRAVRFEALQDADLSPIRSARYLLEDCRRLGTLPFAHLARAGFVAKKEWEGAT